MFSTFYLEGLSLGRKSMARAGGFQLKWGRGTQMLPSMFEEEGEALKPLRNKEWVFNNNKTQPSF